MQEHALQENASDSAFAEEQEHLSKVYATLQELGRQTVERMEKTAQAAESDKRAMAEELSVNLATYADAMETYADFEAMNRIVDAYNVVQSSDAEKLETIALLLKRPYFAKVVLQLDAQNVSSSSAEASIKRAPKEIYIGAAGISDNNCRKIIVDWRSPVAEVYYNQGTGRVSYDAHGRTIEADLLLRRQFDIEEDHLVACFDTTIAIQDPLLLASLSKNHSAAMSAITTTIQREQNAVIRHADVPALLVIGAAGSGKTSVMMQRIAYLFYQERDNLAPDEVVLVTPNPLFQSYVATVLPDMGEKNPRTCTRHALLAHLLPAERGVGDLNVSEERLDAIDEALQHFEFKASDFKAIECEDTRLVSVNQLYGISAKYRSIPAGPRRITLMREAILKRVKTKIAETAASEPLRDELFAMTLDEQTALFGAPLAAQSESEQDDSVRAFVQRRYEPAIVMVERDEWLDIDHIGVRLLERNGLTSLEWLYLKMGITNMADQNAKYVMLDEVQDYSPSQLRVIARYFCHAHVLLLGDPNQAITDGAATLDDIRRIFAPVTECLLPTSYRCTPQITELFARLVPEDDALQISSVQRAGTEPIVRSFADKDAYESALVSAACELSEGEGTAAIIVPRAYDAKVLAAWLGQQESHRPWIPLLDGVDALPDEGVVILPLKLAKGLEFDAVLIPDASEKVFPADELSRRRLYTSISRATQALTILAHGALSPLLV